jgi:hypothetical protein
MTSLTYVAHISRRIIKYGGVGLVGLVAIWWIGGLAVKVYLAAHTPYVPPTVRFQILPKIVFPDKKFERKEFSLELPNDTYPKFKDQAKVYVIYRSKSVIGELEAAKKTAALMGFRKEPTEIKTGIYEFADSLTNRTLTMNVLSGNFNLSYPYLADQLLLNPDEMSDKAGAVSVAKSFLQQAGKMYPDLEEGENKISYWKIAFGGLKETPGLNDANLVRVDFFRKKLDGNQEMVTDDLSKASVSVLVSGSSLAAKKIVEVEYKYINVDVSAPSTYPIKTPEAAYEDLKMGYYWPAKDSEAKSTVIRKVTLAYFEPVTPAQFLQPVYVFGGDGGFTAYVPAVTDKWVQ